MPVISADDWNLFITEFPNAHMLQSSAWGRLKSNVGWQAHYIQSGMAGAQVLMRKLPLGYTIAYIPKGPVGNPWQPLWQEIDALCLREKTVFLKIEPDIDEPADPSLLTDLNRLGYPSNTIQPRRTLVVDLTGPDTEILQRMKQKTRYNIGLAQRKGVKVHPTTDVDQFFDMLLITGERDKFSIHQRDYYKRAFELFARDNRCVLLQAEFDGEPLAAIMVFMQGNRAWYLFGASTDDERNRMPTYLLQWEAMRWSAKQGCTHYDLWGVPDADEEDLEAGFTNRSDGLWGVYRFKRGFGAMLMRSIGAWDRVYNPVLYRLFHLFTRMKSPISI